MFRVFFNGKRGVNWGKGGLVPLKNMMSQMEILREEKILIMIFSKIVTSMDTLVPSLNLTLRP